jgi:cobalt-zinc-cadmium efflux system protein
MTGCGEHPESARQEHGGAGAPGDRGHSHGISADADSRYLAIALGLIAAFLVFEVTHKHETRTRARTSR